MIQEELTEEDCGLYSSWSINSPLPSLQRSRLSNKRTACSHPFSTLFPPFYRCFLYKVNYRMTTINLLIFIKNFYWNWSSLFSFNMIIYSVQCFWSKRIISSIVIHDCTCIIYYHFIFTIIQEKYQFNCN